MRGIPSKVKVVVGVPLPLYRLEILKEPPDSKSGVAETRSYEQISQGQCAGEHYQFVNKN